MSYGFRSYIPGKPLSVVWNRMSPDARDAVFMQVQSIMWQLLKRTSPNFGHIAHRPFRSRSPAAFVRYKAMLPKSRCIFVGEDFQ